MFLFDRLQEIINHVSSKRIYKTRYVLFFILSWRLYLKRMLYKTQYEVIVFNVYS